MGAFESMRVLVFALCLTLACALPDDLDLDRNNPIDPGADPTLTRCGNGKPNVGEACDDGNQSDNDGCTNACVLARCGDGITRGGLSENEPGFEACDDGNEVESDACRNDCAAARCGDGIVRTDLAVDAEGFEACDDGNNVDTDACTSACLAAACGDGFVQPDAGEECDDGNQEDGDECSSRCTLGACGDGIIGSGEECDSGGQDNPSCVNCRLRRCDDDDGCFVHDKTNHCLRVPVGDDTYVHACVAAEDEMPTAVPGKVGVCMAVETEDEEGGPTGVGCAFDGDCEDGETCNLSVAWHRCLPDSETHRVNGYFEPCIPGRRPFDDRACRDENLVCRPAVADRWKGFCSAGESSEGWRISGYLAQIPGSDEAQCYPLACQNIDGDAELEEQGEECSCPELNDFNGESTQNTYSAGGSSFEPRMQGVCLWEECNDQSDEGSLEACAHHTKVPGLRAQCTAAEVCGYPIDEDLSLQALDLTHPTGLMHFQERCDLACNQPGTACEPFFDEISPIAQAKCVLCTSNDDCRDGDSCWERSDSEDNRLFMNYCFKSCVGGNRECPPGFDCHEGHCVRPPDYDEHRVNQGLSREIPQACEDDGDCVNAGGVCLEIGAGLPKFCQKRRCRSDVDCPLSQFCGYGLCRPDIECRQTGCPDGTACHQGAAGYEFLEACRDHVDCDSNICLSSLCLTDRDVGSCRLRGPGFEDHWHAFDGEEGEPTLRGVLELLEPPNGWSVGFNPTEGGGAMRVVVETDTLVDCRLETEVETIAPLEIGARYQERGSCGYLFPVVQNTDYTLRVFNANADGELHRPARPAQIEVHYISTEELTRDCGNGNLDAHEGCDTGDDTSGCVSCRCTRPDWGEEGEQGNADRMLNQPGAQGSWTAALGCHPGREEQILRREGFGDDVAFVYHVAVIGNRDAYPAGELVCRVNVGDGEVLPLREEDDFSCAVDFGSSAGDTVQFFAYWQTENRTMPISARAHIGRRCAMEGECSAPLPVCKFLQGSFGFGYCSAD